jgi:two-component system, OmpR family, alkaline phosphatase synthesis response regulator PhoP
MMPQRVLICDDEIHIVRAAEFKLQRAGYEVEIAGDGQEAWERILARRPDLLVTDCQMPRLDGLGLIRRLRENSATRDLPVLMLSAKGFEIRAEDLARDWNVLKLIAKPFSPRELLQIVQSILGPAEHGGEAAGVNVSAQGSALSMTTPPTAVFEVAHFSE